jgi:hypothetical protein
MRIAVSRLVAAGVFAAVAGFAAPLWYAMGSAQQSYAQTYKVPAMITGADIAFQPSQEGSRVGTLMIRIDGKWVEAQLSAGPRMMPAK